MSYAGTTPQFTSVKAGNIELDGDIVYYGDKDTDGSFRIIKDGVDLKIQVRLASVWTDKDIIDSGFVLPTGPFLENIGATTFNAITRSGLGYHPLGQTYPNSVDHTINSVSVLMSKAGTAMTGGTMVIKIYDGITYSGGIVFGSLIGTSDPIDLTTLVLSSNIADNLNQGAHEQVFNFSAPVNVLSSVTQPAFSVEFISPVGDTGSTSSSIMLAGTNDAITGSMFDLFGFIPAYDAWFIID